MVKKQLTAVLTVLALLLFCGAGALAAQTYSEGYFYYEAEEGSVKITGYFGRETEVTVPASIAGDPVSTIGAGAFLGTTVQVLYLPDTIMTIEQDAIAPDIRIVYSSGTPLSEEPDEPVAPGEEPPAQEEAVQSTASPRPTAAPQTQSTPEPQAQTAAPAAEGTAETEAPFVEEQEDILTEAEAAATAAPPPGTGDAGTSESPAPADNAVPASGTSSTGWIIALAALAAGTAAFVLVRKKNKNSKQ